MHHRKHPTVAGVERLAADQRWLPEGQACRSSAGTAEELEQERIAIDVHGDDFGEEAVGVIGQIIRVGQDLLHTTCSLVSSVSLLSLLDQHVLQTAGISDSKFQGPRFRTA